MAEKTKSDTLWGVQAIATFIGRNRRQTYHYLQNKLIPGRKVGSIWVGSRSSLRDRLSGDAEKGGES
jgi:hypothetical protein